MGRNPSTRRKNHSHPDRVFLDANILFSVVYGSPGLRSLWDLAEKGKVVLLSSNYAVEEARRNLTGKQSGTLQQYLSRLEIVSEADPEIPCPIALPPKDRPILLAAVAGKADILLTGDVTHFGLFFGKTIQGVAVWRPAEYLSGQG